MTFGKRLKKIRMFREMTQGELGEKLGYKSSPESRIAQYEIGVRSPRMEARIAMAGILEVNAIHFIGALQGSAEDIMLSFLWMDEDNRDIFHLFQISEDERRKHCEGKTVQYYDEKKTIKQSAVGIVTGDERLNRYMLEWCRKKEALEQGEISERDYFEWKLGWPATSNIRHYKETEVRQ